ncbi:MAG: galactokinase, partial [Alphaproteobacteria bacterium]|nr:galactokinase [Alphaproteobacteria bacterium]
AVKDNPFVIGARMMGGGFGGCTINIVKIEKIDDLIQKTALIYHEKTGKTMKAWKIQIENGTHII